MRDLGQFSLDKLTCVLFAELEQLQIEKGWFSRWQLFEGKIYSFLFSSIKKTPCGIGVTSHWFSAVATYKEHLLVYMFFFLCSSFVIKCVRWFWCWPLTAWLRSNTHLIIMWWTLDYNCSQLSNSKTFQVLELRNSIHLF